MIITWTTTLRKFLRLYTMFDCKQSTPKQIWQSLFRCPHLRHSQNTVSRPTNSVAHKVTENTNTTLITVSKWEVRGREEEGRGIFMTCKEFYQATSIDFFIHYTGLTFTALWTNSADEQLTIFCLIFLHFT